MNHLGYQVFVIRQKANFYEFLARASSCKYDSKHELRLVETGNCSWCFNNSQKTEQAEDEDEGFQTCEAPCNIDYCNDCLNQQDSMLGEETNTSVITDGDWADDIVNQIGISNKGLNNKIRGVALIHGNDEQKCKDL